MKYDVILIVKRYGEGLTPEEMNLLSEMVYPDDDYIPIEMDSRSGRVSAMGVIGIETEVLYNTRIKKNAFKKFVREVLADMEDGYSGRPFVFAGRDVLIAWDVEYWYNAATKD